MFDCGECLGYLGSQASTVCPLEWQRDAAALHDLGREHVQLRVCSSGSSCRRLAGASKCQGKQAGPGKAHKLQGEGVSHLKNGHGGGGCAGETCLAGSEGTELTE